MTLTKSDIVEDLNNQIGLNKREAKELVDSVFDTIKETLINGEEVKSLDLVIFNLKTSLLGLEETQERGRMWKLQQDVWLLLNLGKS